MQPSSVRFGTALALCIGSVYAAAPFIRSFGYGGVVMAAMLAFLLPFTVGVVAGRRIWTLGTLSCFAIPASFFLHDAVLKSDPIYADSTGVTIMSEI